MKYGAALYRLPIFENLNNRHVKKIAMVNSNTLSGELGKYD